MKKNLVKSLRKLNEFLINDYLMKTSKKCGLHQYKGGKTEYRFICKDETLPEATPKILFNIGIDEMDRIKEKEKLEKEIGKEI